jgi:hypothetical protein
MRSKTSRSPCSVAYENRLKAKGDVGIRQA